MNKVIQNLSRKVALPPGSLIHVGNNRPRESKLELIDYTSEKYEHKYLKTIDESLIYKDTDSVSWINICGIHNTKIIDQLGNLYNLHSLVLEDILNTNQRPKYEDFDKYIFVVFKMLYFDQKSEKIQAEQVSLILGEHFLISLQEQEGDVFSPIRERIKGGKGKIRKMGPDYLAYALLDAIVDNYFVVLEQFAGKIEYIEKGLVKNPKPKILQTIHSLDMATIFMRKLIWPTRDLISGLQREEPILIKETTQIFLKDVYDHTIQVIDTVEALQATASSMLDIYLSSISNKMNEIMKVLTIVATIFIPITFIAGIYGMNFKYMPELTWRWAYFVVLAIMAIVVLFMLVYFKIKKWF